MRVFMTGGAGFLGRAIMRREALFSPDPIDFTVYSRSEQTHHLARSEFPNATYVLGDVRDPDRLGLAMGGHDIVIHMAAMKYVPEGESNVWEAMAVNVDGSRNVAMAAVHTGVKQVIGISTDKACRPVNVYGMSKLVMERLFQEADRWSPSTQFNLIRYGNVIGSTGSVIPFFREQARAGENLTLTNPAMTRFWLTVHSAVELIAGVVRTEVGGTILIPRLPAATMHAVAIACARLEGYAEPGMEDIGQRFGEKVHEDLLSPEEAPYAVVQAGGNLVMYPAIQGPQLGHTEYLYTSNTPTRMLEPAELVNMLQEDT